jgi:large repetitive protein
MKDNSVTEFSIRRNKLFRRVGASTTALLVFVAQVTPALATIDNTATVNGTYGASAVTASSALVTVPVVVAAPALTVSKSAGLPTTSAGTDTTITDASDTITYTYTVKNTGNISLTAVAPTDSGPTFNSIAGTGTMSAFTPAPVALAPGATQVFTATYTLTALDTYRGAGIAGGVSNTASATGKTPANATVTPVTPSTATTTIAAGPKLVVNKTKVLDDTNGTVAGKAEVGEFIDYTYTVSNTGNVAIQNISITDLHEGANLAAGTVKNETLTTPGPMSGSVDTTSPVNNGIWTTIQPGATVTFTYHHLVTQAEVDAG